MFFFIKKNIWNEKREHSQGWGLGLTNVKTWVTFLYISIYYSYCSVSFRKSGSGWDWQSTMCIQRWRGGVCPLLCPSPLQRPPHKIFSQNFHSAWSPNIKTWEIYVSVMTTGSPILRKQEFRWEWWNRYSGSGGHEQAWGGAFSCPQSLWSDNLQTHMKRLPNF